MNHAHSTLLGIGIITYNRLSILKRCIAEIARHTRVPYFLVIADDGSADNTVAWARRQRIRVVTGSQRGCAWNKNRALYFIQRYTDCDPILLLEDDTWPSTTGWDVVWTSAAFRWQHVNYCYGFAPSNWPKGLGTADDPFQCSAFGGHCTITTRRALAEVGFLDTRFVGYGWEHVEWTHRFRLRYGGDWGLPEGMLPCLNYGVRATWPKSFFNQQEIDHNGAIYTAVRAGIRGPYHRTAWQNGGERQQLEEEAGKGWHECTKLARAHRGRARGVTDSMLLTDCTRVLTHAIKRFNGVPQFLRHRVRNHLRAARQRLWEIVRASRRRGLAAHEH